MSGAKPALVTSEIINAVKSRLGIGTDLELARWLGVAQNTVSNWRARGTSPYGAIVEAALRHGVSLDHLLLDQRHPLPWRVPEIVYFQDKDRPGHLDAMDEGVPMVMATNPNVGVLRNARLELTVITTEEYPPVIAYGDQVVMRAVDGEEDIAWGYYYVREREAGHHRGRIVEIRPTLPHGSATVIYGDRSERDIAGRSELDGIYGQVLAVLKPLSMTAIRKEK